MIVQAWMWKLGVLAVAFVAGLALGMSHSHARYLAGKQAVQAQWDAQRTAQKQALAKAEARVAQQSTALAAAVSTASNDYEDRIHEQAPSVAGSVLAGVDHGALRLRDDARCPGGADVSEAAADSRAADAAATQALADRVNDSIAAVRAGDLADQRERQLGAQVLALQSILRAERANPPSSKP